MQSDEPRMEAPLKLSSGERVYTEDDVPALLALAELAVLIEHSWVKHVRFGSLPSTAQTRHEAEHGHTLRFGCCGDRAEARPLRLRPTAERTGISPDVA